MKSALKTFVVAACSAGLFACGGGAEIADDCGEGTFEDEETGQCVPEECGDGEVRDDAHGICVPTAESYCAEGTIFDDDIGLCVGELYECDEDTVDDDGECRPAIELTCGEGTVADDGQCRPHDDVCGEKTVEEDGRCDLSDEVCGQGTTYDLASGLCVPESDLECGPGTTVDENDVCVPAETYYSELASDPDIDLTDGDTVGDFELADVGERVVFVGNIDSPELVDDDYVQDEDVVRFDADAGTWLEISVYSLGLPEPGFRIDEDVDGELQNFRLSDLGAGIEVSRQVVIPNDGDWEMAVSNMPQMLGDAPAAGGDDWGYVGIVETMETPETDDFGLLDDTVTGDIRDLSGNYYRVDAEDVGSVAMIFSALPTDADAEFQVWTDETTLDSTVELGEDAFSFEPPADEFFLLFDRAHAYGKDVTYTASAQTGVAVEAGETISEEISLETGDYVGLLQYNLEGLEVEGRILDDDSTLESASDLQVLNAEEGTLSLFSYARSDKDVTVELENTTGDDLDFLALESVVGTADSLGDVDGNRVEVAYGETLPRGYRHYVELDVDFDDDLSLRVEETDSETDLELRNDDEQVVAQGRNAAIFSAQPGSYVASVEAEQAVDGGFVFAVEETELFTESQTSAPGEPIPDDDPDGISDTISIDTCPFIEDIEVEIAISHDWRSDLIVEVTSPAGDQATLHDREGGSVEDINATYPFPDNSGVISPEDHLGDGEELLDMTGTNGTGDWELHVSDNLAGMAGTLDTWTVTLTCEG